MALFDDIGRKISVAGQKVAQNFGDMSDTSRLNATINEEERKIQNLYNQIGKLYASIHREDAEPQFVPLLQSIAQSEMTIQSCRKQIQKIRGVRTCTKCGGEVNAGSAFCPLCGNPMPVVAENESLKGNFSVCAGCGTVVAEGMRFCTNCGRPVAPRPEAPAAPAAPVYEPAPVPRPEPAVPVYTAPPAPPVEEAPPAPPVAEAPVPEAPVMPEDPAAPAESFAPPADAEEPQEPVRFCPNCGAALESGDAFCMNCGTKL